MDILWKATAGILITVIICLVLSRQNKDISMLLVICVCCMICSAAMGYYRQIFQFIRKLEYTGSLNGAVIVKSVGIALLTEITVLICSDSGNAALGKVIQILSSAVMLWLCIPLFSELLELVEKILGYL